MAFFRKIFSSKEHESRATLSKKVQATPQDPQARQKLGLFLLQQGEIVEGIDQLARAAVLYEKSGFTGKAIAVIRQIFKHDPSNADFQRWLIRLLAQEGLAGDAQRELERAATGTLRFKTDEQKIEFFRQAAESMPKNPLPPLLVADVFLSQRKYFEAASELEKAADGVVPHGMIVEFGKRMVHLASHSGDSPDLLESCGFLWLRAGRVGEASPILTRAAALLHRSGEEKRAAAADKVLALLRQGREEAMRGAASFVQALERIEAPPFSPPGPPPKASEPRDISPEAAQPTGLAPRSPEPEGTSGGAPAAPRPPEPETLRIHAESAPAPGPKQSLSAHPGDDRLVQSAVERLQAKVNEEIGESDPEARYNLGIAYKEMGLLDEALEEFRIARRRRSLYLGASVLLADTLAEKGDPDAAVVTLDEILDSGVLGEPESRDVLYQKAVILTGAGKEEEGLAIFRRLHERYPDYRDVRARAEVRKA